jgi:hypothetical protein
MTFNVPPTGGVDPTGNPAPAARGVRGSAEDNGFSKALAEASQLDISVPATPPAELAGAMERASARYDELRAEGRELHFAAGDDGRHTIQVRDLDGNVLRTLSPSEALDVIAGARLDETR